MLKTGGGAIVNTSSIFGLNGYPGWSLYTATKHAVTGMTKAAALDYAKQNIRVNAVGPGPVETALLAKGTGGNPHSYAAFVPMGRMGQPDEVADAVVWLCPRRRVTFPATRCPSMAACRAVPRKEPVTVHAVIKGHLEVKDAAGKVFNVRASATCCSPHLLQLRREGCHVHMMSGGAWLRLGNQHRRATQSQRTIA